MYFLQFIFSLFILSIPGGASAAGNKWDTRCNKEGVCQMQYELFADGNETPISRLLIYKVNKIYILEYSVPLDLNLQKGVSLNVDGKHKFKTNLLTCHVKGCIGFVQLNKKLLLKLKKGGVVAVTFNSYVDDEDYAFKFSLAGFTVAYNQFLKGK